MLTSAFLLGKNYLQIIPIIPSFPAMFQGFERKGFLPRREVPEAASPFSADGRWDEVKHLGDLKNGNSCEIILVSISILNLYV